jgi:hypothetical protein
VDNIKCAVSCQVTSSKSCNVTPASCMASCSGTGGVILCNGQVVYVADSLQAAATWYVDHWDAQFSLNVMASGGCTGDQCTATVTTTSSGTKCSASPLANSTGNWGLALGGLSFVVAGVARRRSRRS